MSDLDLLQDQLKSILVQLLHTIQTTRQFDYVIFQEIDNQAAETARLLKHYSCVPKWVLKELRVGTKILRAEASHISGERNALISAANRLELIFDLIIIGESLEDRAPGVPRIF
jgi:hypothetical protein